MRPIAITLLALAACKDVKTPTEANPEEVITTVELTIDGTVYTWDDPENDGDPIVDAITLTASEAFKSFRVFDQQSRLYPVFINLVNNSLYWVGTSKNENRQIALDVMDGIVVVSDSGPGVDAEDVDNLFSLFFTRKARGGRGVGLYLSRANLAAGGHRIRYMAPSNDLPLSGATFGIEFRGAEFDGE